MCVCVFVCCISVFVVLSTWSSLTASPRTPRVVTRDANVQKLMRRGVGSPTTVVSRLGDILTAIRLDVSNWHCDVCIMYTM